MSVCPTNISETFREMKGSIFIFGAGLFLLTSCGDTQIEHCKNVYNPVEKGNVDSITARRGEVVSEIPTSGSGEELLREAQQPTDSLRRASQPSDFDESGEGVLSEQGGAVSASDVEANIEDVNRRTSEEAQREAAERQRKALEEMGL